MTEFLSSLIALAIVLLVAGLLLYGVGFCIGAGLVAAGL